MLSSYDQIVRENSKSNKRSSESAATNCHAKQAKLSFESPVSHAAAAKVMQAQVDKAITDFISGCLMPFSIVEHPHFQTLIKTLQPSQSIVSRKALMTKLSVMADNSKELIRKGLQDVQFVSTTTDCWTASCRSYIGLTAHWFNPNTLARESAALACKRLRGSHTFEILAEAIDKIHEAYGIRSKVCLTTTDNGSNFIKAFRVFGDSGRSLDDDDADSVDDEFEAVAVTELFEGGVDGDGASVTVLPPHRRCACHTLNLIATTDCKAAYLDSAFKKLSGTAFGKCQSLWNKSGRSALARKAFEELCGIIVREKGEGALDSLCDRLDVVRLKSSEFAFLEEYVSVMRPLCQALDVLQGEKSTSMGYLLPTIAILREKMHVRQGKATSCLPLLTAILNGLDARFSTLQDDPELVASSLLHPCFRKDWLVTEMQIAAGKTFILQSIVEEAEIDEGDESDEEDFFSRPKRRCSN